VRVEFKTSGRQTLMAVDAADLTAAPSRFVVTVQANAPVHFKVTVPATATAGDEFNALVTAIDVLGNTATSYSGTVHFTSSDPQGVIPPDVAITGGVRRFAIKLKTAGVQRLMVADTVNTSIEGTSPGITITARAATRLTITVPATAKIGSAFYGTVQAIDVFGNTAKSYTGTLHFTSTDAKAALPADSGLVSGARQFVFKLKTPGSQTITATDTATPTIKGTSAPVGVS
jgi:hypothetical protein